MLDKLDGFIKSIVRFDKNKDPDSIKRYVILTELPLKGSMRCSRCADIRKNEVKPLYISPNFNRTYFEQHQIRRIQLGEFKESDLEKMVFGMLSPSLWECKCFECESISYITIYNGPLGQELIVLPSSFGGLSTVNTPKNVSFYLDQANRAHIMGASSAAMAMYRTAVEQILVGEGYTVRMLGPKIQNLIKDIESSAGPKWASDIDIDFLQYIKRLGDSAIHANDGDIERQKNLDNELILSVKEAISFLLYAIYESAHKKKTLLEGLKSTMESMK
ncbi:MAG: DUF4145 domain-containing protein [Paenibacillus sp.]|nr:DUF4145 domain-containing protein [Paenibacillus sp.]